MKVLIDKNAFLSEILSEAKQIEKIASETAAKQTQDILIKAYTDIIDQYYLYKTTSYYRHRTGIGTGTGKNLYKSNRIALLSSNDRTIGLKLEIDASEMEGYPRISKDIVLDNVLNGIRGVPYNEMVLLEDRWSGQHRMMFQREMNFEAKIKVESDCFTGTPRKIMTDIGNKIGKQYYETFWNKAWSNTIRTNKYEFFSGNKKFSF